MKNRHSCPSHTMRPKMHSVTFDKPLVTSLASVTVTVTVISMHGQCQFMKGVSYLAVGFGLSDLLMLASINFGLTVSVTTPGWLPSQLGRESPTSRSRSRSRIIYLDSKT